VKISKLTPLVLGTPWRDLLFLKLETDEGLVGVGEARPLNRTETVQAYLSEAAPRYVTGQDPFEIEKITQTMFRGDFGRAGEVVMTGIALVEIACWDIIGKTLDQPVYRPAGPAPADQGVANGWYTVERTPQEFHRAAQAAVAGLPGAQFDPFGAGFYEKRVKNRVIGLVEGADAVGPQREILAGTGVSTSPAVEKARAVHQPSWRRAGRRKTWL
jgi:galactonate dehydratase